MVKCMTYLKKLCLLFATACLLSSCSADINDYKGTSPSFDLFEYFQGDIEAWGMVKDYTNQQTRRFHVKVHGDVDGDTLTLHEDFVYHDGETDTRVWTITREGDGRYIGKAGDIIGDATGQVVGNALQWQYDFRLKTDEREIDVHFDDWMYRQDERHLFNTTRITKWGIQVGEVTLFFAKQ